ncbi:CID11 [Iris pallida]|uniref:CID11 n=1 Tax=Iris pallida TaxID=29817 RepID=A0AAX6DVK6_IRIPA|nr:CID11 [Iris pallida]KAJ6837768.1 CID11 [Iris pallida]
MSGIVSSSSDSSNVVLTNRWVFDLISQGETWLHSLIHRGIVESIPLLSTSHVRERLDTSGINSSLLSVSSCRARVLKNKTENKFSVELG